MATGRKHMQINSTVVSGCSIGVLWRYHLIFCAPDDQDWHFETANVSGTDILPLYAQQRNKVSDDL